MALARMPGARSCPTSAASISPAIQSMWPTRSDGYGCFVAMPAGPPVNSTSSLRQAHGWCSTPFATMCSTRIPENLWRLILRRQRGRVAWLANAPDDLSMN